MPDETPAPPLTPTQWLICAMAAIGFAFDIYEILVMPLILESAVTQLTGHPFSTEPGPYKNWANALLFAPLVLGGIFGLIGGYLTDLLGRRRVLVWSILLYAVSAVCAGFSTNAWMLLFFRCTTLIGVCVEFVAAVAWLAEIFPNRAQREKVLGFTQAFSSLGGLLSALALGWIASLAPSLPAIHGGHDVWRYLLISGVIPALPLILIRPFMPESPIWQQKKQEGTLKRPSFAELFRPELRRTTIVATLLFACGYGAAFGAIQFLPQIVPRNSEVASEVKAKMETVDQSSPEAAKERRRLAIPYVRTVQTWQEIGGLLGRFALAGVVLVIVSRQWQLRFFQIPGLIIAPLVFWYPATNNYELLKWGVVLAGFFTVAQFSFWGNYLPAAYPTHLRGTGGIFAANVGGRILGTAMFPLTNYLAGSGWIAGDPKTNIPLAHSAAIVIGSVFLIGLILSFFLPEPPRERIEE
jgi:MFS family permease